MKTEDPKIYVLIVTYNSEKFIRSCLENVYQSSRSVQVVVVDNSSQDCTVEIIVRSYPEVILRCLDENLGFGRANNIGLSICEEKGAEYIFLINHDVYVNCDTIEKLYNSISDEYILSPIHLSGDGRKLDKNFRRYMEFPETTSELIQKSESPNLLIDVKFVNAAAWFVPIKVVNSVGWFNPLFSHYGEDVDYVNRLFYKKLSLKVTTTAFIRHDREVHGNSVVFRKGYYYRQLLIVFSNPNPVLMSIFENFRSLLYPIVLLLRGKRKDLKLIISDFLKFLLIYGKVRHYRKLAKQGKLKCTNYM